MGKLPTIDDVLNLEYLCYHDLGLSEEADNDLQNCGSITFGDTNHTMVPISRLIREVDWSEEDTKQLEEIEKQFGNIMIDLEN